MQAIDVLTWPGMNQAFLVSFFATTVLALLAVPYAKRRPVGTPFTWGEAMLASVWAFGIMFLAFGVVPHQWIDHADKDLGWNKTKLIFGPFDLLKPKAAGGNFPMTIWGGGGTFGAHPIGTAADPMLFQTTVLHNLANAPGLEPAPRKIRPCR